MPPKACEGRQKCQATTEHFVASRRRGSLGVSEPGTVPFSHSPPYTRQVKCTRRHVATDALRKAPAGSGCRGLGGLGERDQRVNRQCTGRLETLRGHLVSHPCVGGWERRLLR